MSLAALLLEVQAPKAPTCTVGVFLSHLDADERAEWEEALANDAIQHSTIANYCQQREIAVHADALSRHRRHICRCPRT